MSHRPWLSVCLLPLLAYAGVEAAPAPAQPTIALKFEKTPVADAAKQLGAQLGVLILLDEKVTGEVTLTADVPKSQALQAFARAAQAAPQPALILCTEQQAKGPSEIEKPEPITATFAAGTKLSAVAAELGKQSKRRILVTPEVADLALEMDLQGVNLDLALTTLTEEAGCRWVAGWVLTPVDPQAVTRGLEQFAQMPVEQRNAMFDNGWNQAMAQFRALPAEERRQRIQQFAERVEAFADRMKQADPETRQRFQELVKPLIERGLQKYVALDAAQQAELTPLLKAFEKLR